jgi:hypothetical protein
VVLDGLAREYQFSFLKWMAEATAVSLRPENEEKSGGKLNSYAGDRSGFV